jgi:hypothetical protein
VAAERGEAAQQAGNGDDETDDNTHARSVYESNSCRQRCLHEADIGPLRQPRASLAADSAASVPPGTPAKESLPDGIDNRKLSNDQQQYGSIAGSDRAQAGRGARYGLLSGEHRESEVDR